MDTKCGRYLWVIIGLLGVLSIPVGGRGQVPEDIEFHKLTPEDGLSQGSIFAIQQDHEGYMWFATQNGLNKYNGYEFTTYFSDPDDQFSISSNEVRSLYEDRDGNLWIGTLGSGLNLYDRDNNRFIRFKGDRTRPQQTLSDNTIWAIYEDRKGNFWVGTSWGLNLMKRNDKIGSSYLTKKTHFVTQSGDSSSISSNNITVIFEDSRGNLWVGTENGLNILDRQTRKFKRFWHKEGDLTTIGANFITSIYEDREGQLWIGTEGGGLNRYDYTDEQFIRFTYKENKPNSISSNRIYSIREDHNGLLWIGTNNSGVNIFNPETGHFYNHQYTQNKPGSISDNAILSIFESDAHTMWLGTFAGGINFVDESRKNIEHYESLPNARNSLSHNSVRSFWEAGDGTVLIGTDGGGLNIFDPNTGTFKSIQKGSNHKNSLPSNVILDIESHPDSNKVWLATYDGGVSLFDMEKQSFVNYQKQPGDSNSLSSNDVFELYHDSEGRLWIGTNGGGINMLDPNTGKIDHYLENPTDSTALDNNDVRSFLEDSQGNFWVGTYGGKLARLNRETAKFSYFKINTSKLYSSVIQSIYEDSKGRLWLGTRGAGLKLFDRDTHMVTTYSHRDGLPNNVVNGILEDKQGYLWISTKAGLAKFNPEEKSFVPYGMKDGLQSREFNEGAYYKDRKGYMYFGGVNGFNRFHPDSVHRDTTVPPVALTGFQLFNEPVKIGSKSPLRKDISQTSKLTLPYDASVLTFEYAALDFSPIKGGEFAYKLVGFDKEWQYVGNKRSATYTNLDPGTYTFKVKTSNRDGVWGAKEEMLTMTIVPPFWQTSWFYLLLFVSTMGTIYGGYRWRVHTIQKQNRELEEKVDQRTFELDKRNKDLHKALNDLKATRSELVDKAHKAGMADLASGILHNIGNVLNSINISVAQIEETLNKSNLSKFKRANTLLEENKDNIEGFLLEDPRGRKLLDYYIKLEKPFEKEQQNLQAHCERLSEKVKLIIEVIDTQQGFAKVGRVEEQIQLQDLVKDTLKIQADSFHRHDLKVETEFADETEVVVQKSKFMHVLVNLFKNAKEAMVDNPSDERLVTLSTWEDEDQVHLSVKDEGKGIAKGDINSVFNQGFTTKNDGHGFGLHSSANYISEMDGNIEVYSEGEGKGATFVISFPKVDY